MLNRFKVSSRPACFGFNIDTSIAHQHLTNDSAYQDIFAKQIRGLGQAGDILLAFSSSSTICEYSAGDQTAAAQLGSTCAHWR